MLTAYRGRPQHSVPSSAGSSASEESAPQRSGHPPPTGLMFPPIAPDHLHPGTTAGQESASSAASSVATSAPPSATSAAGTGAKRSAKGKLSPRTVTLEGIPMFYGSFTKTPPVGKKADTGAVGQPLQPQPPPFTRSELELRHQIQHMCRKLARMHHTQVTAAPQVHGADAEEDASVDNRHFRIQLRQGDGTTIWEFDTQLDMLERQPNVIPPSGQVSLATSGDSTKFHSPRHSTNPKGSIVVPSDHRAHQVVATAQHSPIETSLVDEALLDDDVLAIKNRAKRAFHKTLSAFKKDLAKREEQIRSLQNEIASREKGGTLFTQLQDELRHANDTIKQRDLKNRSLIKMLDRAGIRIRTLEREISLTDRLEREHIDTSDVTGPAAAERRGSFLQRKPSMAHILDWKRMEDVCPDIVFEERDNQAILRDVTIHMTYLTDRNKELQMMNESLMDKAADKEQQADETMLELTKMKREVEKLAADLKYAKVDKDTAETERARAIEQLNKVQAEYDFEKDRLTTQVLDLQTQIRKAGEVKTFFPGLGKDKSVLPFLRFDGRVRNISLPKTDVEDLIGNVWDARAVTIPNLTKKVMSDPSFPLWNYDNVRGITKPQGMFADHIAKYLHENYGSKRFEYGYSLYEGMERYKYDADIELFRRVVRQLVPEMTYYDQTVMLTKLKFCIGRAAPPINVGSVLASVEAFFPAKTKDQLITLRKALVNDLPNAMNMSDEDVNLIPMNVNKLFASNDQGNQCLFIETIRDQQLDEAEQYVQDMVGAVCEAAGTTLAALDIDGQPSPMSPLQMSTTTSLDKSKSMIGDVSTGGPRGRKSVVATQEMPASLLSEAMLAGEGPKVRLSNVMDCITKSDPGKPIGDVLEYINELVQEPGGVGDYTASVDAAMLVRRINVVYCKRYSPKPVVE